MTEDRIAGTAKNLGGKVEEAYGSMTGSVVAISSVKPGEMVTGALDATFSTGTLQGQFNAKWCPTGVAPWAAS